MFRASWSLTPMMAAAILVYREHRAAGVRQLFRRIVDYARVEAKIWYLAVFLAGPIIVFVQYALALWSGQQVPLPRFTLLVPLSFIGFFLVAYAEDLRDDLLRGIDTAAGHLGETLHRAWCTVSRSAIC